MSPSVRGITRFAATNAAQHVNTSGDGRRIVVLAFDLHQSDLPLQVAFPLLISNIIGYLAPGSGAVKLSWSF